MSISMPPAVAASYPPYSDSDTNSNKIPIQDRLWEKRAWKDTFTKPTTPEYFKMLMGCDYVSEGATPLKNWIYESIHFIRTLQSHNNKQDISRHFDFIKRFPAAFCDYKNLLIFFVFFHHIARQTHLDKEIDKVAEEFFTEILAEAQLKEAQEFEKYTKDDFALKLKLQLPQEQLSADTKDSVEEIKKRWASLDAEASKSTRKRVLKEILIIVPLILGVTAAIETLTHSWKMRASQLALPGFSQISPLCSSLPQEKLSTIFDGILHSRILKYDQISTSCQNIGQKLMKEGYCNDKFFTFNDINTFNGIVAKTNECKIDEFGKTSLATIYRDNNWDIARDLNSYYNDKTLKTVADDDLMNLPFQQLKSTQFTSRQFMFLMEKFDCYHGGHFLHLLSDEQFTQLLGNLDNASLAKVAERIHLYAKSRVSNSR